MLLFLPIVAVAFAKMNKGYDNNQPRAYLESLADNTLAKRMVWAQANSWEALMIFAPAVLLTTMLKVDATILNLLACGFILARLAYLWCYAKDWATARTLVWVVGVACVIGLYVSAALT